MHYERAANLVDTYQALGGEPVLPEVDAEANPEKGAAQGGSDETCCTP